MGRFEWTAHAKDQRVWNAVNWIKGHPEFAAVTWHFDFAWVRVEVEFESLDALTSIERLCKILRGNA